MRKKVAESKWNEGFEGDRRGREKWTDFIINLHSRKEFFDMKRKIVMFFNKCLICSI